MSDPLPVPPGDLSNLITELGGAYGIARLQDLINGGGGGVGQTLTLTYNGQTFDVPVSSLPAGWSGSGIACMQAQLTTGPTLVSGLLDSYGNPIPDGFTFPATIMVATSDIIDIIASNAYVYGNPGQTGISWWNVEGGVPSANIGPDALILTNLPTTDPAISGAWWNDNGVMVASGFTPNPFTPGSSVWVDLGLVDLVSIMDGPTTLYDMPEGSFLSSIRFTDDPDSVALDFAYSIMWLAIGTEKSFGWNGFAGIGAPFMPTTPGSTYDSTALAALSNVGASGTVAGMGYGPLAALDGGLADFTSLVLSAASVGPIQVGLLAQVNVGPNFGMGAGVRVAPITAWEADTAYDSPVSNTVATPGVLQKCAILANGTIWVNLGATGTSGGSAPDFAGNAGGGVADGPDILWNDTTSPPPTVGAVHVVAEIVTPFVP